MELCISEQVAAFAAFEARAWRRMRQRSCLKLASVVRPSSWHARSLMQVHHVRLHAAPSQRAYLPQWLAAPLGRRKPDEAPPAAGPGALPPIAEHGSTSGSRRISDDLSHLKASAAPPPPLSRESLCH